MPINYYDLVTYLGLALLVVGCFLALTRSPHAVWILAIASIPLSSEVLTGDIIGLSADTVFFFPSDFWAPILVLSLLFTGRSIATITSQTRLGLISLAYFAWMFLCSLLSSNPQISIKYFIIQLIYFFGYGLLSYVYLRNSLTTSIERIYSEYVTPLLIVVLFFCIVEHLLLGASKEVTMIAITPFFREHTVYGAFTLWMLVAYGVLLWYKKRESGVWVIVGTIVTAVAWFLAYSRAAWLVGIVVLNGTWILGWLNRQTPLFRFLMISITLLGGSAGLVYAINNATLLEDMSYKAGGDLGKMLASSTNVESNVSNLGRLHRWQIALEQAISHPFTGIGPSTFAEYYHYEKSKTRYWAIFRKYKERFAGVHSEYLTAAAEMGFIGFGLLVLIYFVSLYYPYRLVAQAQSREEQMAGLLAGLPLLSYYLSGVVNNFMDHGKMAALVYLHWGIAMAIEWHLRQKSKESTNNLTQTGDLRT